MFSELVAVEIFAAQSNEEITRLDQSRIGANTLKSGFCI
jgi:hypothetical protein